MAMNTPRESAKIYQFPVRNRTATTIYGRRDEFAASLGYSAQHASGVVFGESWYHDAAIEDAKKGREH